MRILSCSILVLAGAIWFAGVDRHIIGERNIGALVALIGGILFAIEYVRTWNVDRLQ